MVVRTTQMKEMILMIGIPVSGKSTYINKIINITYEIEQETQDEGIFLQ